MISTGFIPDSTTFSHQTISNIRKKCANYKEGSRYKTYKLEDTMRSSTSIIYKVESSRVGWSLEAVEYIFLWSIRINAKIFYRVGVTENDTSV